MSDTISIRPSDTNSIVSSVQVRTRYLNAQKNIVVLNSNCQSVYNIFAILRDLYFSILELYIESALYTDIS